MRHHSGYGTCSPCPADRLPSLRQRLNTAMPRSPDWLRQLAQGWSVPVEASETETMRIRLAAIHRRTEIHGHVMLAHASRFCWFIGEILRVSASPSVLGKSPARRLRLSPGQLTQRFKRLPRRPGKGESVHHQTLAAAVSAHYGQSTAPARRRCAPAPSGLPSGHGQRERSARCRSLRHDGPAFPSRYFSVALEKATGRNVGDPTRFRLANSAPSRMVTPSIAATTQHFLYTDALYQLKRLLVVHRVTAPPGDNRLSFSASETVIQPIWESQARGHNPTAANRSGSSPLRWIVLMINGQFSRTDAAAPGGGGGCLRGGDGQCNQRHAGPVRFIQHTGRPPESSGIPRGRAIAVAAAAKAVKAL